MAWRKLGDAVLVGAGACGRAATAPIMAMKILDLIVVRLDGI
jgi:hypothetical protein